MSAGVCFGENADQDCAGVCGDAVVDLFGVCNGTNDLQGATDAAEAGSTYLFHQVNTDL